MWAVMACDNSGVVDGSSLRHVLVVGGSLDQWKSMTVAEWTEYITTLRSSVEQVGAGWLTVYPYSGNGVTGDDSEFAEKISNALGAVLDNGKILFDGPPLQAICLQR